MPCAADELRVRPRGTAALATELLVALLVLAVASCQDDPTSPEGEDDWTQLLANPDMEAGGATPVSWESFANDPATSEAVWLDQGALSGSRALGISSVAASASAYWRQIVVISDPAEKTFLLRASIRLDGVIGQGAAIAVRADDSSLGNSGAEAFATSQGLIDMTGTRGWTSVDVGLSAVPADVDQLTVFLMLLPNTVGAVYFDDATLSIVENTNPTADRYFRTAIDIMELNSIKRYELDWPTFRDAAWRDVTGAQRAAHTHRPIRLALARIGDNHSSLIPPPAVPLPVSPFPTPAATAPFPVDPSATLLDGGIGYVDVPAFSGGGTAANDLATSYHRLIEGVDSAEPCGWVVDLRGNLGGNMWPMVAGVGPLLGEGVIGYFVDPDSVAVSWFYEDGRSGAGAFTEVTVSAPYTLWSPDPPVAVLTDSLTASSGEATAIAFRGRPGTRSFGQATYGVSTANRGFPLSDGAVLNLTVSTMADRTRALYGGEVVPDELVAGTKTGNLATDAALGAAVEWLRAQALCAASP